jgi:hypothetical protein
MTLRVSYDESFGKPFKLQLHLFREETRLEKGFSACGGWRYFDKPQYTPPRRAIFANTCHGGNV